VYFDLTSAFDSFPHSFPINYSNMVHS